MTITIETLVNLSACAYGDGQHDLGNDILSLASKLPTKANTVVEFLYAEFGPRYTVPAYDAQLDIADSVLPYSKESMSHRLPIEY